MIYDCFCFHKEIEVLDIRFNILSPYVDKFIVIEAKYTHANQPRPLFFQENKLDEKYGDKIIHIVVDSFDGHHLSEHGRYAYEYEQRDYIDKWLKGNAVDDDVILVSDVDEIPNPKLFFVTDFSQPVICEQNLYIYYLNAITTQLWLGTGACRYRDYRGANWLKRFYKKWQHIQNCGWHFSFIGGVDRVVNKIESYSEQQVNNDTIKNSIASKIKNLQDPFDTSVDGKYRTLSVCDIKTLPIYIQENIEQYRGLLYGDF